MWPLHETRNTRLPRASRCDLRAKNPTIPAREAGRQIAALRVGISRFNPDGQDPVEGRGRLEKLTHVAELT